MTARLLTTSMGILLLAMVFSFQANAKNWNQIHESPWTEEDIQASLSKFDFWLRLNYGKKKKFCELNPSDVECLTGASDSILDKLPDSSKAVVYKEGWNLPFKRNPSYETLLHYLYKHTEAYKAFDPLTYQPRKYEVKPSINKMQLESDIQQFELLDAQMRTKGILSYLFFDNGKIVVDKVSPRNRFGDFISNDTHFRSNSVVRMEEQEQPNARRPEKRPA